MSAGADWRAAHLDLVVGLGGLLRGATEARPRRLLLSELFRRHAALQTGGGEVLGIGAWAAARWPALPADERARRALAAVLEHCDRAGLDREELAAVLSRHALGVRPDDFTTKTQRHEGVAE